jgi:hypothetical protein
LFGVKATGTPLEPEKLVNVPHSWTIRPAGGMGGTGATAVAEQFAEWQSGAAAVGPLPLVTRYPAALAEEMRTAASNVLMTNLPG